MYYCFLIKDKSKVKYYFTGTGFDTIPFKMKKYKSLSALRREIKEIASQIPTGYSIYSEKVKAKPKKKTVKNKWSVYYNKLQIETGLTYNQARKLSSSKNLHKNTDEYKIKKVTSKSHKKNPVPKSKWNKLKEATKRYEDFSGHQAKFIDEKDLRKLDVGFKIGTVDFIGYTTKRDGRVEKYIHKFKAKSRPILASNYDGKFISLVNGKYEFTNRGIVDT